MSDLQQLATEIQACRACRLGALRTRAVPGEGNPRAKVMFIGEAPGWYEDQSGRPFVGAAGKLLEELLASIGLKRSDVFIANVLKCRPPENRDPFPDEIEACDHFLRRQIEAISPPLIVTLGRYSMAKFFPSNRGISQLHGTTVRHGNRLCYALYHPAAVLRNPSLRPVMEEEFRRIPDLVAQAEALAAQAQGSATEPAAGEVQQLSLF